MTKKLFACVFLLVASAFGQPPNVTALSPAGGTGTAATFNFTINNYPNPANFNNITIVFKTAPAGSATPYTNSCVFQVTQQRATPIFWTTYLMDDSGTVAAQGGAEGQFYTWQNNSRCGMSAGFSHTVSGNTITFSIPITFKSPGYGPQVIFTDVNDVVSGDSGWESFTGYWTAGAISPPSITSFTGGPASPSLVATYSIIVNDPMGQADISYAFAYVGNVGGGLALNCQMLFAGGTGYLWNDAGTAWTPITNGYVQNSQCVMQAPAFSASGNTQTYSFTVSITGNLAAGNYQMFAYAIGNLGGAGPWAVPPSTWPIPAPLGPLTSTHTTTENQLTPQYDDYTGTMLVPATSDTPTLGLITSTTSTLDPFGIEVSAATDTFSTTLQGAPPGSTVFVTVKPGDAVYPCTLSNGNPQVCTPPSTDVNWCGQTPSIYTGAWAFCGPPGAQQTGIVGSDGTFTMTGSFQGMRATVWTESWLVVFSTDHIGRYLGTAYIVQ